MIEFFKTNQCLSGVACQLCRAQSDRGQEYRDAKSRLHGHSMDECPYGKVMGTGDLTPVAPTISGQPVTMSIFGTMLHRIIEEETGAVPCGECKAEIVRLNTMTLEEIQADRKNIAKGIVKRAKTKAPEWWQRWGATLLPGKAIKKVYEWMDKTFELCQSTQPHQP